MSVLIDVEFEAQLKLTVRIAPGARARTVVVRELTSLMATYAIFDRYPGSHQRFFLFQVISSGLNERDVTTDCLP